MDKIRITSDNHVHTAFSTDSSTSMEDMLKTAINMGFSLCQQLS